MDRARAGRGGPRPIEDVLRSIVLVFRVLSLMWMGGLVTATLLTDDGASVPVVATAMTVAVATTAGTWWASQSRERLASWWWITVDGVATFFIAISPGVAGADDLFFGGMPLSWILLVVYAHSSFLIGGVAVGVLTVSQFVIAALDPDPLSATEYVGRIAVWVVSALAYGWAMWAMRRSEHHRLAALADRDRERIQRRLADERAEIAAQLHDSVLQTLALLRRDADDPKLVQTLARKQSVELRNMIDRMASPYERSFRAAMRLAIADVEDTYGIETDTAFAGDCELSPELEAVVKSAREALVNAARHAGVDRISLFADVRGDSIQVVVTDRGNGFEPDSLSPDGGLARSVVARMERHGGTAVIDSTPGVGTEIELRLTLERSEDE